MLKIVCGIINKLYTAEIVCLALEFFHRAAVLADFLIGFLWNDIILVGYSGCAWRTQCQPQKWDYYNREYFDFNEIYAGAKAACQKSFYTDETAERRALWRAPHLARGQKVAVARRRCGNFTQHDGRHGVLALLCREIA